MQAPTCPRPFPVCGTGHGVSSRAECTQGHLALTDVRTSQSQSCGSPRTLRLLLTRDHPSLDAPVRVHLAQRAWLSQEERQALPGPLVAWGPREAGRAGA